MTTYKVWIEVEELDDAGDNVRDHDLKFASTAEFSDLGEACAFAERLHVLGKELQQ